jgi:hypothetical protein
MTFSPIISAAGTVPDPAGNAPDPAAIVLDPATGVPDPAATVPDPGIGRGQPAEPEPDSSNAGYAADTGQHPGYAADTGQHPGYAADTGQHPDYAADSLQEDEPGASWPHQSFLELGALPTAAPCARLHATLMLWEWQLGALVRTAALVVSELVSNAVQASAGLTGSRFAGQWAPGIPPVRLWLSADEHRLVIQVWDGSDRPPVPQAVAPEADSGRGLLLVGSLSAEWGCYTPEKSSGKVVWAVVTG